MMISKFLSLKLIFAKRSFYGWAINNALDVYTGTYDKLLLARDFNVTETETVLNFYTKIILIALLKIKHVLRTLKTHDALTFFLQNFQAVFKPPLPSVQVYLIFTR